MRTISIANQKGGCGKTTTSINLASAIACKGKRILLIDLDPQAHASFGLGASNQAGDKTIYNVLTDNSEKKRAITDCILNVSQNLDIVPSNILLSTLEQELKDKEDAVSKLHIIISTASLNYDFVIVDCPPNLGFLTFNALRAADHVIVPIDMSAFSLMGVGKLLGMLELIKLKIHHSPRVNALATLFDRRTKYSQTMLDEIRNFFKDQMLETVVRTNVALKKAASKGISVIQFDRESNGAKDHMALAEEILRAAGAMEFEKAMEAAPLVQENINTLLTAPRENISEAPKLLETATREISFTVSAPQAKEVYVVGDFNQWKVTDDNRLSRLEDGKWEKRMSLVPGRYKYKFIVDGEWALDSENLEREANSFGTFDSIIKL